MMRVSRSGYYDWLIRPESRRCIEDRRLKVMIKSIHQQSRGIYGAWRIQHELTIQGETISRARVSRLMKQLGIQSKTHRKFKATTNSNHRLPVAANRLDRAFQMKQPDTVYVGDITYIPTEEGWLYLAVLIDLYSRSVVGWAMSNRMTATLVNDALLMACFKRRPARGLIVHSDRGSQYASHLYQATLTEKGFICSMSRRGNCWDNAPAESFFHTLKTELTHHYRFATRAVAKQMIFEYIEVFYNRQRRHSSIDYQIPEEYHTAYAVSA